MNNSPQTPNSSSPWAEQNAIGNSTGDATRKPDSFTPGSDADRFSRRTYVLKKQFFKMLGASFRIYDENAENPDGLLFFSKQKAFKLKEEIRLWTGEDMSREVLSIKARRMLDISATYDVTDSTTSQKVGALRRKGLKSMLQDEWLILDAQDREIGMIKEDSTVLALIRRFIEMASLLIPQSFHGFVGNNPVCVFKQNANPFLAKIHVDFSADTGNLLDRRLGIAAAVLLCAIEGKQG